MFFFRLDRERLPVHLQGSHQALCSSAFLSWKVAKQNVHAWKYRRVFRMKIQWTPHSKEKKAHKRPPKSPGLFSPLKIRNTPWRRKIMKSVTPIQCKRKSAIMVRKCYFPLLWCLAEINERNSSGKMEYSVCQSLFSVIGNWEIWTLHLLWVTVCDIKKNNFRFPEEKNVSPIFCSIYGGKEKTENLSNAVPVSVKFKLCSSWS